MIGRVLIVAGSDSGGGAGIQADIKAVTAMGAFAATAITALTAQNTEGVHGVVAVEPAFIAQQIEVVLSDIGADALKTGMLHSAEVIGTVASSLKKHAPGVPLVVDPVMIAKGGHRLLLSEAEAALRDTLLPMAALLTPNLPEAEVLAGFFLGAYVGLSAPVIALGVATEYVTARNVMLVFVVLAAIAIAAGARGILHRQGA